MPLEQVASETGLSVDSLRSIESGRREPLVTTALLLAEVLDVQVEDIFRLE